MPMQDSRQGKKTIRRRKRRCGGGSLYKRDGRGAWIVAWVEHDGRRRARSTRTTDRVAAERILAKLTADAALRREGVIDPRIEYIAKRGREPIETHLADWKGYLASKRNTRRHVQQIVRLAERTLADARVTMLEEMSPFVVLAAVSDRLTNGVSARTCNHALRAVKSFSRWCLRDRRLPVDPLLGLSEFNGHTDRRLLRRPLSQEEVAWLLAVTEEVSTSRSWSGPDRAMLYRLALGTGFRASELRSLRPESFDLTSTPPCVTVAAAYSKRRREDRQPLRADLAELLEPWLADRPRGCRVFRGPMDRLARMLRADLRRAKAHWIREAEDGPERRRRQAAEFLSVRNSVGRVVDFHALRMTYVTSLVRGGASVKVAQTLARHSTPVLTLNTYTVLGMDDLVSALNALPGGSSFQMRTITAGARRDVEHLKAGTGVGGPD